LEFFACDILFIHRDSDNRPPEERKSEIEKAMGQVERTGSSLPGLCCVIPVQMMEAWLLSDESAIRKAAGNPRGREFLNLPRTKALESQPDAKALLHEALKKASGRSGRRLQDLKVTKQVHRVAELIDDFSPLRQLPAFRTLGSELEGVLSAQGWLSTDSGD